MAGVVAVFVCMGMVPPVAIGQEVDRRVAITFDDVPATALPACGPAAVDSLTGRLLDTLDEFDVRAMAFVVESRSCGPDARGTLIRTLERWLEGGHDLGNHTATHPDLNRVSLESYEEDMLLGAQVADSLLRTRGRRLRHFRPPYLHMGPTREKRDGLRRLLMKHRYELGPVTMDNQEWVYEAAYRRAVTAGRGALAARIAEAYLEHMEEVFTYYEALSRKELGREIPHILLLHANVINGDHLASVLRILEQRGYRFISVDDALEDPAYDLPDRYVGPMGLSWLQRWLLTRGADVPPEPREVAWVARLAAGDGLPSVHGFRWRRADRWLDGRLTLLPGSPGPWGLLDLPGREGGTRLPVTRIDTIEEGLAFTIGAPEGRLSVADTAAGGGLLVIQGDTFRVADFRALDAHPAPDVVALIGVDPVAPGILSTDRANRPGSESGVFVDPAERYIIFVSTDRPDSRGGDDLYISWRVGDRWSEPRNLGAPVNTFSYEYGPTVSPDGRWLYFTSHRRASADLYRVRLDAILDRMAQAQEAVPDTDEAAVRTALEAASRAFSRAYVSGDTATLRDLYSADAVLLPPEREIRGRDAIVRYFAPSPRRRNLAHAMRSDQVRVFGETAIDVGEWSNTWQVGETAPREASGRYLVVWRKGTDGRWRMEYDMWHRPVD